MWEIHDGPQQGVVRSCPRLQSDEVKSGVANAMSRGTQLRRQAFRIDEGVRREKPGGRIETERESSILKAHVTEAGRCHWRDAGRWFTCPGSGPYITPKWRSSRAPREQRVKPYQPLISGARAKIMALAVSAQGTERAEDVASMLACVLEMDVHDQTRNRETSDLDRDYRGRSLLTRPCYLKGILFSTLNDVAA
ncbi:Uncharacterized protein TCM_037362 [Theobroma cacao]|uniref:Uncharacterized protein n=1 Tax=Theobroma cacao TaxID=3641 RepID=A0A061GLI0_THECC|nr:Uncharacterized protein TCM_037362 [Theobroma cacao]